VVDRAGLSGSFVCCEMVTKPDIIERAELELTPLLVGCTALKCCFACASAHLRAHAELTTRNPGWYDEADGGIKARTWQTISLHVVSSSTQCETTTAFGVQPFSPAPPRSTTVPPYHLCDTVSIAPLCIDHPSRFCLYTSISITHTSIHHHRVDSHSYNSPPTMPDALEYDEEDGLVDDIDTLHNVNTAVPIAGPSRTDPHAVGSSSHPHLATSTPSCSSSSYQPRQRQPPSDTVTARAQSFYPSLPPTASARAVESPLVIDSAYVAELQLRRVHTPGRLPAVGVPSLKSRCMAGE
jgi:hypothetical protein